MTAKELHLVGFRIGKETFGVPIHLVHEIVRLPEITAVPEAPDYIEGVINLRGKIISIVDLRKRFGERNIEPSRKNRILVAEIDKKIVGLIVDAASEVMRLPESEIEAPPSISDHEGADYITGVGKLNGRLVILIDLTKVLQKGELRRLPEMAAVASA
jgi:purine-binding chemotaxis protein CheW